MKENKRPRGIFTLAILKGCVGEGLKLCAGSSGQNKETGLKFAERFKLKERSGGKTPTLLCSKY